MTTATIVGSGPNGLAAALTLAAEGIEVTVLEASPRLGGGTRTSELTVPGVLHDECSAAHPLAVDNRFMQRFGLTAHGLRWRWADVEYAHPLDGGHGAAAYRSVERTATALGPKDGETWRSIYGALFERFDGIVEDFTQPMLRLPSHPLLMARFGAYAALPADVLARRWTTPEARALFAGVAAHALRPFSSPMSSAIGVALGTAAHRYGWPVAEGGSRAITDAMISRLRAYGARLETDVRVRSLADLERSDVTILDLDPQSAADVAGERIPSRVARALRRYRRGPGTFKVEFAVQDGIPWAYEPTRRAGTVHLSGDLQETAMVERMVNRGRMPDRPYVLLCQQYLADPGRSHGTTHPIYAYAHVPHGWTGDATDRIETQIERFAPGFRDRILARNVRSVAQTEAYNSNYAGGDSITGRNDPLQMVFRPRISLNPYSLGAPGLFICSAATPPGAGAHGMCGFNAANVALSELGATPARGAR